MFFFQKIENEIRQSVDENVKLAKSDTEIGIEELCADVYADNLEPYIRNTTPFEPLQHISVGKPVNL